MGANRWQKFVAIDNISLSSFGSTGVQNSGLYNLRLSEQQLNQFYLQIFDGEFYLKPLMLDFVRSFKIKKAFDVPTLLKSSLKERYSATEMVFLMKKNRRFGDCIINEAETFCAILVPSKQKLV